MYGILYHSYRILEYDPINEITSSVGGDVFDIRCGDGVLGKDLYAATDDGKVLKIDATNNSHRFVGIQVKSEHLSGGDGWGDAVLDIDGCIYCPPCDASRILKYDPHTNLTSLAGDDFGANADKWSGGCLAADRIFSPTQ